MGLQGLRLRDLRESRGYTQEELADMINVGTQQIWRWESGKTDPASDFVVRLAKALSVTTDYLLGLDDDPSPQSQDGLDPKERSAIAAWRLGDITEAVKIIVNG